MACGSCLGAVYWGKDECGVYQKCLLWVLGRGVEPAGLYLLFLMPMWSQAETFELPNSIPHIKHWGEKKSLISI